MGPYVAISIFVTLGVIASQATSRFFAKPTVSEDSGNRRWTYFDFVVVAALVIFSALRFQVGTDYVTYLTIYNAIQPGEWASELANSPQELGYTALSILLRGFTDWPYLILWAAAILTVVPIYAALKKHSTNLTLAVVLYILLAYFVSPFNVIRQGIAVALSFWANSYLGKNNAVFVLINLVAASFHASALAAMVAQVIARNWRPTFGKAMWAVAAAGIAASLFAAVPPLAAWLTSWNPRYSYVSDTFTDAGIGTYLSLAMNLTLLFYALYLGRTQENSRWMAYVLIGVLFLIVGTQSLIIARMEAYFGIFLLLLIPNQLAEHKQAAGKIILVAVATVHFVFYLQSYGDLSPYQTYWEW